MGFKLSHSYWTSFLSFFFDICVDSLCKYSANSPSLPQQKEKVAIMWSKKVIQTLSVEHFSKESYEDT